MNSISVIEKRLKIFGTFYKWHTKIQTKPQTLDQSLDQQYGLVIWGIDEIIKDIFPIFANIVNGLNP